MADPTPGDAGRYSYDGLDRVLHEKARLGILTALVARRDGIAFTELARLCSLTDGNLSRHLDVLAKAEPPLVDIHKGFDRRRPLTTCRITPSGRRRFREYLTQLEQVLRDAAVEEDAGTEKGKARPGLAGA
ncbi:MAG: transcriptional regulator [Gemmataceae bacterium]|nr:transcriptional regulator [Gemmataceae bacterium]